MGTEFWLAHVASAAHEAIPASEYARRHGLAVKSLYYWRRKLQAPGKADAAVQGSKFVSLRIAPDSSRQNNCTLKLSSRLHLEMSALPSPEWLAAIERALPEIR
jgi:transposase-like protein